MANKVIFDTAKVKKKISKRIDTKVQAALDQRILADSNYYAPEDEGFLKQSGITFSKIGEGKLEWNTPYAVKQYYSLPNKSKDKNPNARMKWFEVAKKSNKDKWLKLAQGRYDS